MISALVLLYETVVFSYNFLAVEQMSDFQIRITHRVTRLGVWQDPSKYANWNRPCADLLCCRHDNIICSRMSCSVASHVSKCVIFLRQRVCVPQSKKTDRVNSCGLVLEKARVCTSLRTQKTLNYNTWCQHLWRLWADNFERVRVYTREWTNRWSKRRQLKQTFKLGTTQFIGLFIRELENMSCQREGPNRI